MILGSTTISSPDDFREYLTQADDSNNLFLISHSVFRNHSDLFAEIVNRGSRLIKVENRDLLTFSKVEKIRKQVELLYRKNPAQGTIYAIGGGSVIDLAKSILFSQFEQSARTIVTRTQFNRIIAIPTTSGSGSEVTQFATLWSDSKEDERVKFSIDDERLKPSNVILFPALMQGIDRRTLVSSLWDAVCHSIESLVAKKATIFSTQFAESALTELLPLLNRALRDKQEFSEIQFSTALIAASYSGNAINITRTNFCHSMSYPLTRRFGISHGIACSLSIPLLLMEVEKYNFELNPLTTLYELIENPIEHFEELLKKTNDLTSFESVIKDALKRPTSLTASILSSGRNSHGLIELNHERVNLFIDYWKNF